MLIIQHIKYLILIINYFLGLALEILFAFLESITRISFLSRFRYPWSSRGLRSGSWWPKTRACTMRPPTQNSSAGLSASMRISGKSTMCSRTKLAPWQRTIWCFCVPVFVGSITAMGNLLRCRARLPLIPQWVGPIAIFISCRNFYFSTPWYRIFFEIFGVLVFGRDIPRSARWILDKKYRLVLTPREAVCSGYRWQSCFPHGLGLHFSHDLFEMPRSIIQNYSGFLGLNRMFQKTAVYNNISLIGGWGGGRASKWSREILVLMRHSVYRSCPYVYSRIHLQLIQSSTVLAQFWLLDIL